MNVKNAALVLATGLSCLNHTAGKNVKLITDLSARQAGP